MVRFLATLATTLLVIVAATAWWSRDPTPETTARNGAPETTARNGAPETTARNGTPETTARNGAPEAAVDGVPEPRASGEAPAEPAAAAAPEAPAALVPTPVSTSPRRVPAIPAPSEPGRVAALPAREIPAIPAPRLDALEAERVGETVLPERAPLAVLPTQPVELPTPVATPFEAELEAWERQAIAEAPNGAGAADAAAPDVAMNSSHDASAARIRRLLDVYDGLWRRR